MHDAIQVTTVLSTIQDTGQQATGVYGLRTGGSLILYSEFPSYELEMRIIIKSDEVDRRASLGVRHDR